MKDGPILPKIDGYQEGELMVLLAKRKDQKWICSLVSIIPEAPSNLVINSIQEGIEEVEKKYRK